MKKFFPLLISMLWVTAQAYAQIYYGDLTLSTQAQINAFAYEEVSGKLTIGLQKGNSDITDLTPLRELHTAGSLCILNNNSLPSLKGLEGLTVISKILYVSSNDALQDMQGLNNLQSIGNNFYISYNDGLINLEGLDQLQSIGRDFFISTNIGLQSLQGASALQTIKGSFILVKNKKLTDIDGIAYIHRIPGNLIVENNILLSACCWLKQPEVGGRISVNNNADGCKSWDSICTAETEYHGDMVLATQEEVDQFHYNTIYGSLKIGNPSGETSNITNLEALSVLNSVYDITIHNCDQLSSLKGLEQITELQSLHIYENPKLKSLQGFNNLKTVSSLYINHNDGLLNLKGLENLSESYFTEISDNNHLASLQGLEKLSDVIQVSITHNEVLASLVALSQLQSLYELVILNNGMLKDLQGLENITSVDDFLFIGRNANLTSLKGLDNLEIVFNSFAIDSNPILSDIEALRNLERVYDLSITGNTSLSTCCVLLNTAKTRVYIADNATGCNSGEEYASTCTPSSNTASLAQSSTALSYNTSQKFQAYPNPVAQTLHLQGYTGVAIISNALGQPVKQIKLSGMDEIDLSNISAGVYILQVAGHDPVSIIRQ